MRFVKLSRVLPALPGCFCLSVCVGLWDLTFLEQLENAEDAEEGDDDVTKENAREEKEIMQVLIDILGKEESQQKKSSIPVNGDS